jgi:hypothetical protein
MTKSIIKTKANRELASRDLSSTKLTDAQRAVLSGTAQRDDGAATLPERMTEKAAQKLAVTLIAKGLVREVRARAEMPVWRRNEAGRACALIVTKFGREAIKGDGDRQKHDAAADAPAPSIASQGSKLAAVMTLLGRKRGVAIEELTSATGWLPHTTRAALTGLRKRGHAIERSRSEQGGSVYRIVAAAASALAA